MGYKLNTPIWLSVLAEKLSLQWIGSDILVESVAPSNSAVASDITFAKVIPGQVSGVAVITKAHTDEANSNINGFVITENPRLTFIKVLGLLEKEIGFSTWDEPAVIHPSAKIGKNVVIENGCIVGENSIIEHNVVLHAGTRVGKNSRIRSCSSIGGDGFGFERLDDGTPVRFPHLGGVIIGDNVEVGSCTTIACGTLSDTIIQCDVKIDNLVHVAHNCLIKKGAFVIACAELSGGVTVGENAWIAPNSCTHQKITIGDQAVIGLGAVVTKDVPAFSVFAGNPAKKIREI